MSNSPFKSITDSVKAEWNRTDNSLVVLIAAFVSVYLLLALVRLGLHLFTEDVIALHYSTLIFQKLSLCADWRTLVLAQPWAILSYSFVYFSLLDLFFGMVILYSSGRLFMYVFGDGKLMAFAIMSAFMSALFYMLLSPTLEFFQVAYAQNFSGGAAGLAYALLVASATIRPNEPIRVFIFGPFKLKYVAMFVVGITFLGFFGRHVSGHLGAALGSSLLGWVYALQYRSGRDWSAPFNTIFNFLGKIFGRKQKKYYFQKQGYRSQGESKKSAGKASGNAYNDKSEQEIIDAILDKINESGYESLSTEEKQLLFKASKKGGRS